MIDTDTPNRLLATVTEIHNIGKRILIVKHRVDSSSDIDWKGSSLDIRGSSGSRLLRVEMTKPSVDAVAVAVQQSTFMDKLVQTYEGLNGSEARRSRIVGLTELTYTAIGGVDPVKLDAILRHCKQLRRLSVTLPPDVAFAPKATVLRTGPLKGSASLQVLELRGGKLWWLRDLSYYKQLTLECSGNLHEGWFREAFMQKLSKRRQQRVSKATTRLDLRLRVESVNSNPFVIAKFSQICVADEAEVTISASGECEGANRTWLDNVRSTLELLQMESKAERNDE